MLNFIKRALLRRFGIRVTVTWEGEVFTHFSWTWNDAHSWMAQYPVGVTCEAAL